MAYPGETSRRTMTSGALTWTEVTVNPYASGDRLLVLIPDGQTDGTPSVLVVVAHGHNSSASTINGTNLSPIRDLCISRGWMMVSADASGNAWANDDALADYRRAHDWVNDTWPVTDVLLHGASMGGLTMALAYAEDTIPNVRGMAGVDSAVNLRAAWDHSQFYRDTMGPAYGIAPDGSDFEAKTAGHDVVTLAPTMFTGKRLWLSASPGDTSIPKAIHTDLLVGRIEGYPATLQTRTGAGGHVSPGTYFPTDVVAFYEYVLDPPETSWPDPVPLPPGIGAVDFYTSINGVPVPLEFV